MSGQARVWGGDHAGRIAARDEEPGLLAPRILVVDSDNLHRMIICRAADRAGYVPAGAANFIEAATLAQTTAFDCITLDAALCQKTGGEVLRHLAAIGYEAPLLLVGNRHETACREALRLARSLGLDVGEPLSKPVDVGMLRYALDQLKVHRALRNGLAAVEA